MSAKAPAEGTLLGESQYSRAKKGTKMVEKYSEIYREKHPKTFYYSQIGYRIWVGDLGIFLKDFFPIFA